MNNKKGISAVIATVLIILITVAAVTIIWVAVIPMITGVIDHGKACLDATTGLEIVPEKGYTCYNPSNVSLQIARKAGDFNLDDVQIVFEKDGETRTGYLLNATGTLKPTDATLTTAHLPSVNEERVYVINHTYWGVQGTPTSIKIAAVVKAGQEPCDASQPVVLKPCV